MEVVMLRQNAHPRPPIAARAAPPAPPAVRQLAARGAAAIGRILIAPFALALAAIAGMVYAVLLPICGIASIAEATARASWALVRGAFRRTRQGATSRA